MKSPVWQKKKISSAAVACIILAALLLVFGSYSLAKYLYQAKKDPLFAAKAFYFESDLLSGASGGSYPKYTLKTGVDTIEFTLENYPDGLRYSEVDIVYDVVLTKEGVTVGALNGQTIDGNARNSVSVSFDDLAAGTYVVTATATAPYASTLRAQFTVVDRSELVSFSVRDEVGSPVLQMTVQTADYEGEVTITWPEGVLPDNMDLLLEDASNDTRCVEVNVEAESEYTFLFYKPDPTKNYSADTGFSATPTAATPQ